MVDEIYQKALLRLAANATGAGVISNPDIQLTLDNPTCGDRVTVQLRATDGQVTEFAHDTRACMLCQASISLIGQYIDGCSARDLSAIREQVWTMLNDNTEEVRFEWPELEQFRAVADYKSRHFCILLPFDVLIEALGKI